MPEAVPYWHLGGLWFIISMNAWNMPMFFFLSGIRWWTTSKHLNLTVKYVVVSAYFALTKRSLRQFRLERLHRLLVPALTLALTSALPLSLDWVSRLSPECRQHYYGNNTLE